MMLSFSPAVLSPDILFIIINQLSLSDKENVTKLNKEWRFFMRSDVWLWTDLWLEDPMTGIKNIGYDTFLWLKSSFSKTQLGIRRVRAIRGWQWLELADHFKWHRLIELELCLSWNEHNDSLNDLPREAPNLVRISISGIVTMQTAIEFLENCLKLKSAEFLPVLGENKHYKRSGRISPVLRDLKFSGTWQGGFPESILINAFALRSLTIRGLSYITFGSFSYLTSLRRLYISCCHWWYARGLPAIAEIPPIYETGYLPVTPSPGLKHIQVIPTQSPIPDYPTKELPSKLEGLNTQTLSLCFWWFNDYDCLNSLDFESWLSEIPESDLPLVRSLDLRFHLYWRDIDWGFVNSYIEHYHHQDLLEKVCMKFPNLVYFTLATYECLSESDKPETFRRCLRHFQRIHIPEPKH